MSQLYVGVDWHKRTSTWVAINEERKQVYVRSWGCTPHEVHAAISSLPAAPENIVLGVEPVCGWRWMTQICMDRGIADTCVANPKRLREIAQTAQKTDKNDVPLQSCFVWDTCHERTVHQMRYMHFASLYGSAGSSYVLVLQRSAGFMACVLHVEHT